MQMKLLVAPLVAASLALPLSAWSQAFPSKPVRVIVPYPAGGTTDLMARALQEPVQRSLGQPLIIENKPGASGIIAAREVARSAPDGHTLLFINSGIVAVTPFVVKDAGFDGVKDFAPIALVSTAPLFLVINAATPAKDLREFIEYAKAQANPLEFASAGTGSFGHLASELFARSAGIKMTHVPYKGQAPTTNAIAAGEVKMLITTTSAAMNGFISSGKLRLLGVTSTEPSPLAPGAPAVASILPGYAAETWFGIIAAASTPASIAGKLNEAINATLMVPDMQQRFAAFGVQAKTATPGRVGQMIAEDVARWSAVVRQADIRAD
jgi:tripartite-type tricarboxylate transporter receptor subunit TctC